MSAPPIVGDLSSPVRYRGLKPSNILRKDVSYGTARWFALQPDDLVTLENADGGTVAWLFALPADQRDASLAALGLGNLETTPLDPARFDHRDLSQLLANRDASVADCNAATIFDHATHAGERFTFRVQAKCEVVIILPTCKEGLEKGGGGRLKVEVQHASQSSCEPHLPSPLGRVRDEWRVPKASAHAYEVRKGEFVQIIDVQGQQCSDFMAMNAAALDRGHERFIDSTVTRSLTHGAYPRPGTLDKFFDQDMKPLMAVVQDTVGRHDTFALACTARGYEERGFPGHINCSDNISEAYAPFGIQARAGWPAVNLFFNSWITPDNNNLSSDEAWSRPGDYVAMQALRDLVCVSTACPDDVDPINGWNPTDIHVRVYEKDTAIHKSMYYRAEPEDEGSLTIESAFHPRTGQLTSNFQVARDIWMPAHFDGSGAIAEYWACKEAATLQDMSSLRKFDVMGPDAERLLQHCMTRNVARVAVHRGLYSLMCDERGSVIDDGTLFRLSPDVFRWCCGSDNSGLHLQEQADAMGLRVWIKALSDTMPNLALQGPKSRDILNQIVFTQPTRPALDNLKWFGFTVARLKDREGAPFMLTRSGFTGELGYEIFCDRSDALTIWDTIIDVGTPYGLKPMGGEALEMLRIEAGLMAAGAEFGPDADAYESGLAFAVDMKKPDFLGRSALERNAGAMRRKLVGLRFEGDDVPSHGDAIFDGRQQVGIITSATRSPQLGHAIAIARIAVENAEIGNALEVGQLDGHSKRMSCYAVTVPFIDPGREKPRM